MLRLMESVTQFLPGKGVMVAPVLQPETTLVRAYFPRGNWFDLFNYSQSVSVPTGGYVTLNAPPDHINVLLGEGNILAMQGEAMTTEEARKTPFHLLVVISTCNGSSGELFLDDGAEVEMGRERGRWSLVKFSAQLGPKSMTITSDVINGGFASSQKWFIEKVTILGLPTAAKMKEFTMARKKDAFSSIRSMADDKGEFVVTEFFSLKLPVGQRFKMELNFQRAVKYRNPTKCS